MNEDSEDKGDSPSDCVDKAISHLQKAKAAKLSQADEIENSITILQAGKSCWDNVDRYELETTISGASAINFLGAMFEEASFIQDQAEAGLRRVSYFGGTVQTFGAVTNSASENIVVVSTYDPDIINNAIEQPIIDEKYASKFDKFNPELGRLYRQFVQIQKRTTSYPVKSMLPDIRQAYDVFFRSLSPDDDVRRQPSWNPVDPDKPEMVSRRQRLEYAINKHVSDDRHKATLLASTDYILSLHDDLNKLYHTEKPIDEGKAQSLARSMIQVLNRWADALNI